MTWGEPAESGWEGPDGVNIATGAASAWQKYLPRNATLTSDPNSLQSGSVVENGDFDTITLTNSGTARITADVMLAFVFDERKDADGVVIAGTTRGSLMEIAVQYLDALPAGVCVSVVAYNGGGAAPGVTDEGYGVRVQSDGAGGHTVDRLHSTGGGWADGSVSTPAQTAARFGKCRVVHGSTNTQQYSGAWMEDGAGVPLDGVVPSTANFNPEAMDTVAVCLGWFDTTSNDGAEVDVSGHEYTRATSGPPRGAGA